MWRPQQNEMVTFQLIPHANVTNNNKRLWIVLHQMYHIYARPLARFERWTFREKDALWFDIVYRLGRVEFYVSTTAFQAPKLKRKLENKMNATLREASREALAVPPTADVYDFKYLRHDIYSLNTNTNDTKTPMAALLNVVDELIEPDDFARLSVCVDAYDRRRWAHRAAQILRKGEAPAGLLAAILGGVHALLSDIFDAIHGAFFKASDRAAKQPRASTAELAPPLSRTKADLPVFNTYMRAAVASPDRLTRDTIADSICGSYAELADANELIGVKVRIKARREQAINELNTLHLSPIRQPSFRASSDELSKLALQLPVAELQRKYADALNVSIAAESDVPTPFKSGGIHLGVTEYKDRTTAVSFPVDNADELYRAFTFIGGMGAGKDTAIKNWIIDAALNHGIGAIVPDVICEEGARGMADGLRDSLPPDRVIDLDLANGDYVVPLDLTEVITQLGRAGASRFADELVDFFGDIGEMAQSRRLLRAAAKASGGSLHNVKRIIENETYRFDVIERLQAEGNQRLANDLIEWGTNTQLGRKADALLNRLDEFFGNDTLYDVFCQDAMPDVDFARWMREGKVVIIRVPIRKLGAMAARTLVHWIALKTYMTRLLMAKDAQENGCFIVFNEPEQYSTEGLTRLMGRIGTEGRKERLGSLYAFHHWNKLPGHLQENLQGGGVQQFLFANDHRRTFELSAHRIEPLTLEDAVKLPNHHAIISARVGGTLQHAFICKMAAPQTKRYDNSFLTLRHARMYGRSWAELQNGGGERECYPESSS